MMTALLLDPAEAPPQAVPVPAPPALATAVGGFLALGACAALGAADLGTAARAVPAALMVTTSALVLTGPALVVGHQYLRLGAAPADLVGVLATGFVRSGRLALGLAPTMAFFSATTGLWGVGLCGLVLVIGAIGITWMADALRRVEATSPRLVALVGAWTLLTTAIALRLAVGALSFVAG